MKNTISRRALAVLLSILLLFAFAAGCAPDIPEEEEPGIIDPETPDPDLDPDPSAEAGLLSSSLTAADPVKMPAQPALEGYTVQEPQAEESALLPPAEAAPVPVYTMTIPSTESVFTDIHAQSNQDGMPYLKICAGLDEATTLLKFDISAFRGEIESAVIQLYVQESSPMLRSGVRTISAFAASDAYWSQYTVTYSSAPQPAGEALDTVCVPKTADRFSVDIGAYARSMQQRGQTVFTVLLKNVTDTEDSGSLLLLARRGERQPVLRLSNYAAGIEITDLGIETDRLHVNVGVTRRIPSDPAPRHAGDKAIVWESSDERIAAVDAAGNVTGVSEGTCTVTATARAGGLSKEIEVSVKDASAAFCDALSPLNDTSLLYYRSDFPGVTPEQAAAQDTNWSDAEELTVASRMNFTTQTDYSARSLLQFSLAGFGDSGFSSVVLKLYVRELALNGVTSLRVGIVRSVQYDTVTYAGYGQELREAKVVPVPSSEGEFCIDLTSFFNAGELYAADAVNVVIEAVQLPWYTDNIIRFASAEAEDPAQRPQLLVEGIYGSEPADAVEETIAAVGAVNENSFGKIVDAVRAYNALTDGQKRLVSNVETLKEAQARYYALVRGEGENAIVYPKPEGYMTSVTDDYEDRYVVAVGDKVVPVYPADCTYNGDPASVSAFVHFDFTGSVKVRVATEFSFSSVVIRPLSLGIEAETEGNMITFTLYKPCNISIEFDGNTKNNLQVFTNPVRNYDFSNTRVYNLIRPEQGAVDADALLQNIRSDKINVLSFEEGIYTLNKALALPANTYLYIGGAAVLEGIVSSEYANGSKIIGSGILSGEKFERSVMYMVRIYRAVDFEVNGIILQDSPHWTFVPVECENLLVENLRIIGQHRANNDGMDIISCRNTTIDNCYVRTIDDALTIKGANYMFTERGKNADITYQNNVIWNYGAGQALQLGTETSADYFEDIVFRNVDIIHNDSGRAISLENGDSATFRNIVYDDIRIETDGGAARNSYLITAHVLDQYYSMDVERGKIDGVIFNNIRYGGTADRGVSVSGYDEEHTVRNLSFYAVRSGTTVWTQENAPVYVGQYASDVNVYPLAYSFHRNKTGENLFEAESLAGTEEIRSAGASGGGYIRAEVARGKQLDITVNLAESRHYVPRIGYAKSEAGGAFRVAIDGRDTGITADLYSATSPWQEVVYPTVFLEEGCHTIRFIPVGKHSSAEAADLLLDYIQFDAPCDDSVEAEDMQYTGAVSAVASGAATGGYYIRFAPSSGGETAQFTLHNSFLRDCTIRIQYLAGPNKGRFSVRVNGQDLGGVIDTYAAEEKRASFDLGKMTLPVGELCIELIARGKNELSSGAEIAVDAFRFVPPARAIKRITPQLWVDGSITSENAALYLSANAQGGYVRAATESDGSALVINDLRVLFAQKYRLVAQMRFDPDMGIVDAYFNGELVRSGINAYAPSAAAVEVYLGSVKAELENVLRFVKSGKDPSAQNSWVAVYEVKLIPVADDYEEPQPFAPVGKKVSLDPAAGGYLQASLGGLALGDVLQAEVTDANGAVLWRGYRTADASGQVLFSVSEFGLPSAGEYELRFTASRYAAPVAVTLLSCTMYSPAGDLFAEEGGWSGNSGISFVGGAVTIEKGTDPFTWVQKEFSVDLAAAPYFVVRCDDTDGAFAVKIASPQGGTDIELIRDTSRTGLYFFDLRDYLDASGNYTFKLFNVCGTQAKFSVMQFLQQQ